MGFIKRHKRLVMVLSVLVLYIVTTFTINFVRISNNQSPILVIKGAMLRDGGTTNYYGLGYVITDWNEIRGKKGWEIKTLFYSRYFEPGSEKKDGALNGDEKTEAALGSESSPKAAADISMVDPEVRANLPYVCTYENLAGYWNGSDFFDAIENSNYYGGN